MKLNSPTKPRTAEDLLAATLARLCGAFEAYRNGPTGLEGSRRRKYIQALLVRMWVLEKRAETEKRPVKRFASFGMEIDYRRAVTACGVDDALVIGPTRPIREVGFRWAWCVVARERGWSLEEVARSLGRRSHSWLVDTERSLREGLTESACVAREFAVKIREALDEKRCGVVGKGDGGEVAVGGDAGGSGRAGGLRPVPSGGQRGFPVSGDARATETGDLVPSGVAVVQG